MGVVKVRLEFDSGHRVPWHDGKCRYAHGHRYVAEIGLSGEVRPPALDDPQSGMVVDFGKVKQAIKETIIDKWDHGFFCYQHDVSMRDSLALLAEADAYGQSTIILWDIPTAENLAILLAREVTELATLIDIRFESVRLWETPNYSTVVTAAQLDGIDSEIWYTQTCDSLIIRGGSHEQRRNR